MTSPHALLRLDIDGLAFGDIDVLGPIKLDVHRGETLALIGPSGVGKSTLLRIIAGLETRHRGDCETDGTIAIVFQEPTLLPWRSLADNICIPTGVCADIAARALADVGLGGRDANFPGQLSLGQQRRLSLARAFALQPDLLLMDEPFVSLDPALADEMMTLFANLRARHGVTTVLVTHIEAEAQRLASRIVTLGGAPAQITGDAAV